MSERQRQQYLNVMGIHSWYSRYILPAAKPFNIETFQREESNSLKQANTETLTEKKASPETSPALYEVLGILDTNNIGIKKKATRHQYTQTIEKPIQSTGITGQTNESDISPPFRIKVISPTHDILVVSDTPLIINDALSTEKKRLVFSILFALGFTCLPLSEWETDAITWPLPGFDNNFSEKEAGSAVRGFLVNRFGLTRKKIVLLFGPFSARHAMNHYINQEQLYGVHKRDEGGFWGVTHSIDQILKLPVLKPEVWKHIGALTKTTQ